MDFVLIEQALNNLLLNAAHYTPAGTTVEVKASATAEEMTISVADRGPGLPPESLPHVFEKFYRAPGAPAGGTGLGLSIVKGLVEAHGGRVEARNRPGGGAEFSIHLPMWAARSRPWTQSYEREHPHLPVVLIIDDEIQMRRLLRVTLEGNGYRVFEAASGQEGLVEAAQRRPDIVVLDLGLPDMDGLTVLQRLREWSEAPCWCFRCAKGRRTKSARWTTAPTTT
jgi:CheY-like chemotaxis protein